MKALIVGGTSSLGLALKPVLSKVCDVITAGRKNCDIRLDLNDPIKNISIPTNTNVVIHTASHFGGKTGTDMLEAENVNTLGTLKLCHSASKSNVNHFIFISSIFTLLREDSPYYSIYSLSKRHSEEIAKLFSSNYSLPLTILRPSQIYGNDDRFRAHQPFIYSMVDNAERDKDISIYGSNDALRNYIHIDDLTKIITKVIQNEVVGTYACMYTKDLRYSKIAKAALLAFNSKGKVYFDKDKPDIPDNIFEQDNSLYEKIGFFPQISIKKGMRKIAKFRGEHL